MYLISRKKLSGPLTHFGVLATGVGGLPAQIIDLTEHGVRTVTLEDFSAGLEVTVHRGKPPAQAREVILRARELLRQRPNYDAIGYNCEHLATHVLDGKPSSGQVDTLITLGALALVVLAARE